MTLEKALKEKVLILDGAMGTILKKYKLNSQDFQGNLNCYEILNKTREDLIQEIHEKYILAGADIIETNSFNCNSINLFKYSLEEEVYKLSKKSVEIAKKAAKKSNRKIYIFGAVGPTSLSLSFLEKNSQKKIREKTLKLKNAFKEQILGLIDGGVDAILFETICDIKNIMVALDASEEIFQEKNIRVPILTSITVDKNGELLSGESIEEFIKKIDRESIIGFGINCSFGSWDSYIFIERMKKETNKFIVFYPNAGLPDKNGKYKEKEDELKKRIEYLLEYKLIDIVGGCCGTDYSHIKVLKKLLGNKK